MRHQSVGKVSILSVKGWRLAAFAAALIVAATMFVRMPFTQRAARSVRPVDDAVAAPGAPFDPAQSAAVFVGVRSFRRVRSVIPYAVDDAVDLAYTVAFHRCTRLVLPQRIVLALEGEPVKSESRRRLQELLAAGAQRRHADAPDILNAIEEQSKIAGRGGIFLVSIATHGVMSDGVQYILGASSLTGVTSTMVPMPAILDTAGSSPAERSAVFVDACRERLTAGTRAALSSAFSSIPTLTGRMTRARGQAVFYAAAPGTFAYDGDRNGVFTRAVIDGLQCKATAVRDAVTARTLSEYVERSVRAWVRKHRDPLIGSATQASLDGEACNMPLAQCLDVGDPKRVDADGQVVVAFDKNGQRLWTATENGMIATHVLADDLFRKHVNEVVALWRLGGAGRLVVYDPDGEQRGVFDRPAPFEHVVVSRQTSHHAPKIIVATRNTVFVLNPRKVGSGKPLWSGRVDNAITGIEVLDYDRDAKRDIAVTTANGTTIYLDFEGHVIGRRGDEAAFTLLRGGRRGAGGRR